MILLFKWFALTKFICRILPNYKLIRISLLNTFVFCYFSHRVMAPPGGQTHINVFSTPEPEAQKPINKCQEARSKSSVFAGPAEMNPSREISPPARQTNVSVPDDKASQHTSTKVLAPPGGKTNFSIFSGAEEQARPQGMWYFLLHSFSYKKHSIRNGPLGWQKN